MPDEIDTYLDLLNRRKEDWQVEQALDAIQIYQLFISRSNMDTKRTHDKNSAWKTVADEMVRMLRLIRTIQELLGYSSV